MSRTAKLKTAPADTQIPWNEILREARQRFHIQGLRPGQREVLESVFKGQDTLAIMPTGAGKSLTYQLPAVFLPKPVVVVSPLIALMQDQQEKAQQAEITVESMNSTLRVAEELLAEHQIAEHIAQLIYVTPERLANQEFLQQLKDSGGISLLVVDEAHTIAQWGHDFRPAFLTIGEARKALGNPPVLALTATATEEVANEILASLHAEDATRINIGTERSNLSLKVHPTVNTEAKLARILAMLEAETGTGILYTASVRSANELFEYLTEHGISVAHYHGKMPARERERIQHEFMRGDHKLMIATKAFGLGIDKSDIRFVYHFEFPDSLETYYQEAGRAGRDGEPARAVLLYRLEDKRIQSFFLAGRYPKTVELQAVYLTMSASAGDPLAAPDEGSLVVDAPTVKPEPPATVDDIAAAANVNCRRVQVILNLLTEAGLVNRTRKGYAINGNTPTLDELEALLKTYVDRAAHDQQRLQEMMHYAETPTCRTQVIRRYFGDDVGEPCNRCDNCEHSAQEEPVSVAAEVQDHHEQVHVIETLHGEIHTTRDQPSSAPAQASFAAGAKVMHQRFGAGKVLDVHDEMVLVRFSNGGEKRLRADFLKSA